MKRKFDARRAVKTKGNKCYHGMRNEFEGGRSV
jgi:hypothetical protein